MSPKPSRLVAVLAALSLASCSSIGTINGHRLDVGAKPPYGGEAPLPAEHHLHPCEDFEFLCIVGVGGLIALIVVLAQDPELDAEQRRVAIRKRKGIGPAQFARSMRSPAQARRVHIQLTPARLFFWASEAIDREGKSPQKNPSRARR